VVGSSPTLPTYKTQKNMTSFELDKNGNIRCKKCGSNDVSVKAGMMVDRAFCNNCQNEDYL